MTTADLQPIPQPPEKPLIGNVLDLGPSTQVQDLMKLAREYGDIFYLQMGGRRMVIVSSFELTDELCDESRFDKRVWAPLQNVRAFAGDGLFTAHTFEPNWSKAHHILLPSFSMAAMKGYHDSMVDIARQLCEKWERLNPHDEIDVADEMTRLTLDTIGLCGFDYRFNSFYRDRMHPFIRAMTQAMSIALGRSVRPPLPSQFFYRENRRFKAAVELMNRTVDGIIKERRTSGEDLGARSDLLSKMLVGVDPETGDSLDDVNIRYQIITFLIAGHETTSGLLSFALYFLVQHPQVLDRAFDEVDRVLGTDLETDPTYAQVGQLRYLRQILEESLRLWPTAPLFALFPKEGQTVIGERYEVSKRDGIAVLLPMLHRDPQVWGERAEVFDPEHFSPEQSAQRPPNAFKPFGNGQRACIGRQFALHEATLALGMLLQRFEPVDPGGYRLRIKETLTLKPDGFRIQVHNRARPATAAGPVAAEAPSAIVPPPRVGAAEEAASALGLTYHGTPLLVLYGSNMGTAEGVARRVADDAERAGFDVDLAPLDERVGRLPTEGGVVLVSASYNGRPPDNARGFCDWLSSDQLAPDALSGVQYAVFGCGHRDWASTFQAVPTLLDEGLAAHGAQRMTARGGGDAGGDFDGDFENWYGSFWPQVAEALDIELAADTLSEARNAQAELYQVEILEEVEGNPYVAAFAARPMVIVENRELQGPASGRSTRHIELALPQGVSYSTGDHLAVIAENDRALVKRALTRFGFTEDTRIRIEQQASGHTHLPLGRAIGVSRLLTEYVELQEPATRSQIAILARYTDCPPERDALLALCGNDDASRERYRHEVLERRQSLLDLIEAMPACDVPFAVWLGLLPSLHPRYYSISSSPSRYDRICSLTVGVVEGPARSGKGIYKGVCSSFLAGRAKGEVIHAFVRAHESSFRLPEDPATPIIMVGPGTGVAPFRGFLQERDCQMEKGQRVGPAMLFFGCRHAEHDFLYRQEMEDLAERGVCELSVAFSRQGPDKVYVQHEITEKAERIWTLLESGAVIYVCGDAGGMAPDVRAAFGRIFSERTGSDSVATEEWLRGLEQEGRYRVDVWAS